MIVCPEALGPFTACPVAQAPWDLYLLTLNLCGYVYFNLKVNIKRVVAQYICLNNWRGKKSKSFFQAGDFHLLGAGLCCVSPCCLGRASCHSEALVISQLCVAHCV